METKHENIKSAIRRFEYFNNFSDEKVFINPIFIIKWTNWNLIQQITECCVISKIEQFNPQEIIFSPSDIVSYQISDKLSYFQNIF